MAVNFDPVVYDEFQKVRKVLRLSSLKPYARMICQQGFIIFQDFQNARMMIHCRDVVLPEDAVTPEESSFIFTRSS